MEPDFVVGGVVRGDDFCFRESFVNDLWESLIKQNVLLLAPRRMGKTSVMYRLLDYPRHDWLVIHLNVEACYSPAEFFIGLIDALNDHQPDFLRQTLGRTWDLLRGIFECVEEVEFYDFKIALRRAEDWEARWPELAHQLIERIAKSRRPVLFIVDELPDMLINVQKRSPDEFEGFLHTFREIRQAPAKVPLRWLVGGSVNIRGTLDELGLVKSINDFDTQVLPPFSDEEVAEFVRMMLSQRKVRFDDTLIPRIQVLLGNPVPIFLQILVQELHRHQKRTKAAQLTKEHVDYIFQHVLLGETARDKLQHYRSRIQLHYPEQEVEAAYAILDHLAQTEGGSSRDALYALFARMEEQKATARTGHRLKQAFQNLLWRLESDFYTQDMPGQKYDFGSRLLKLWWRKHYGYEVD